MTKQPQASLSLTEARSLALHAQGLLEPLKQRSELSQRIQQLGYIQIDAINVIERAHHHVLWNRCPDYQTDWLNQLLAERQVFEYWGHAASYLPFADYRYYLPQMQNFVSRSRWAQARLEAHGHLIPEVLARIRQEGPLAARDFSQHKRPASGWWNWKPAKIVLELLYWQGELMVSERKGFDKVYDLAERILPPELDQSLPTQNELAFFCLDKAIAAHGLISLKQIQKHLPLSGPEALKSALHSRLESSQLVALRIEGLSESYYARPASLEQPLPEVPRRPLLLSPFDNLVIQRQRFKDLFGGDYQFEAYVPQPKRRYGYFSLPLFIGSELLGYLDLKAQRQHQTLNLQQATWLRKLKTSEEKTLKKYLLEFARFNGCQSLAL